MFFYVPGVNIFLALLVPFLILYNRPTKQLRMLSNWMGQNSRGVL